MQELPREIIDDAGRDWLRHMRRGEFERAWTVSDRLLRTRGGLDCSDLPRQFQWIWRGAPLEDARVLIRCYHGLGDTLHFIRYAPLVRARARHVTAWVQPSLVPLLDGMRGIHRVIPLHDGAVGVAYDVDVEVMELPFVFRTTAGTIPAAVPYLDVAADPISRAGGPAVGIVWQAGDWAEHRSIPFARLAPLFQAPVTWYVLQGEPGLGECPPGFGNVRGTHSILEAARVIRALDLLITIDSMPAHLAGALGMPVWTLLPHDADWRWMTGRGDSPWYPTMRLFRQHAPGDWAGVLDEVSAELTRFCASRLSA